MVQILPAGADGTAGAPEGFHAEAEGRAVSLAAVAGLHAAHWEGRRQKTTAHARTHEGGGGTEDQREEVFLSGSSRRHRSCTLKFVGKCT